MSVLQSASVCVCSGPLAPRRTRELKATDNEVVRRVLMRLLGVGTGVELESDCDTSSHDRLFVASGVLAGGGDGQVGGGVR